MPYTISNDRKLHWLYKYVWRCNWRPENIYVSETKSLKYQQNIEGNSSFRISKCKHFLSSLAPLTRIFIDFLNVSVLSVILSFIMPYHCIGVYTCRSILRPENTYISEALAHISYIYMIFFLSVHLGVLPPPPIVKNWLRYCGRVPLPHPPLGVPLNNRYGFPHPLYWNHICTLCWRLFGARVDVNLNLIMHKKPVFSTQNSKKFPPFEGIPPPTPSPLVSNTLFNKTGSPLTPCTAIIYISS